MMVMQWRETVLPSHQIAAQLMVFQRSMAEVEMLNTFFCHFKVWSGRWGCHFSFFQYFRVTSH